LSRAGLLDVRGILALGSSAGFKKRANPADQICMRPTAGLELQPAVLWVFGRAQGCRSESLIFWDKSNHPSILLFDKTQAEFDGR
jgi:hypothetical protein